MPRISIFDIFKIGVGPSSSHTLGPWKAALNFVDIIKGQEIVHINVQLFGSLSKTGVGHGTDIAVILGLLSYDPKRIDTKRINDIIFQVNHDKIIEVNGVEFPFDPKKDIHFEDIALPEHPNTLDFTALCKSGVKIEQRYLSVGGGFIEKPGESLDQEKAVKLPFPINTAKELLQYARSREMSISQIVYENEKVFQSEESVDRGIEEIYKTMIACVYQGSHTGGVLPGGLHVKRRAEQMAHELLEIDPDHNTPEEWIELIKSQPYHFNIINKWVSCFALSVNEENAAFGRVVTSPTNGAAGVIPAVLLYYLCFCEDSKKEDVSRFLMTAGEIGCLFKRGATISAAVGGCQAEIGVSSAMAAAGLTELLGGTPKQVLIAAEIAMEHHLGMTCDPIGGLVQIPCIERNAMGAMKAITASNLALCGDGGHAKVTLDDVIGAMWETAKDMNHKYKETSEGGLAIQLSVIQPSC